MVLYRHNGAMLRHSGKLVRNLLFTRPLTTDDVPPSIRAIGLELSTEATAHPAWAGGYQAMFSHVRHNGRSWWWDGYSTSWTPEPAEGAGNGDGTWRRCNWIGWTGSGFGAVGYWGGITLDNGNITLTVAVSPVSEHTGYTAIYYNYFYMTPSFYSKSDNHLWTPVGIYGGGSNGLVEAPGL